MFGSHPKDPGSSPGGGIDCVLGIFDSPCSIAWAALVARITHHRHKPLTLFVLLFLIASQRGVVVITSA